MLRARVRSRAAGDVHIRQKKILDNDTPQKFVEDEGLDLEEAFKSRYLLASWVAKEVLLKAVNLDRAHALPAF